LWGSRGGGIRWDLKDAEVLSRVDGDADYEFETAHILETLPPMMA
jgi:hypothetical protein